MEFKPWPKIVRVENRRHPIFTEKIDGTNACIAIDENGNIMCQSRSRIITPEDDNYGFARWVHNNAEDIRKLGKGYHYGEWWGLGIQRRYNQTEKKFSLFNTKRWNENNPNRPDCCGVVPIIPATTIEEVKEYLIKNGSIVAPGFMNVEGAVMLDIDTDTYFKIIIHK